MTDIQLKPPLVRPNSREIAAYVLDFLAELADLAQASGQTVLAADLKTVRDRHAPPNRETP
jgi:hypothetical protein